jgi:hypothetical protein
MQATRDEWWTMGLTMIVIAMLFFLFGSLAMESKMSPEMGEKHTAFITFENEAANNTTMSVYVMNGGQWDLLYGSIEANSSTTVQVNWHGDMRNVTIFAVFDYGGYTSVYQYVVNDKEVRTVFLI